MSCQKFGHIIEPTGPYMVTRCAHQGTAAPRGQTGFSTCCNLCQSQTALQLAGHFLISALLAMYIPLSWQVLELPQQGWPGSLAILLPAYGTIHTIPHHCNQPPPAPASATSDNCAQPLLVLLGIATYQTTLHHAIKGPMLCHFTNHTATSDSYGASIN